MRPDGRAARSADMAETIETLQRRMDAAVAALDFEEAGRCRDMISALRGGASPDEAEAARDAGLRRQEPGAMGLGTSRQQVTPPAGWRPPPRPDPMTSGRSGRRRRGDA